MPTGFARDSAEALHLMGLGFDATLLFTAWRGSPHRMPNFGIPMPKGLMLSKERRSRIKYIEISARKNLQRYTFQTSFGNFLPFKAYERWKSWDNTYKKQFNYERDKFLSEYDSLPDEVRREADEWIAKVFRLVTGADDRTRPTLSFSENIVSLMLSKIPAKRELAKCYRYKVRLLPYLGLGITPYSGQWPSSNNWIGTAKEGLDLSKGSEDNLFEDFTEVVMTQFSQKCRSMLQRLLEIVSRQSASHSTLTAMENALLDTEALNFFDNKEISKMVYGAMPFVIREKQQELEGRVSDLLAYINENFTNR